MKDKNILDETALGLITKWRAAGLPWAEIKNNLNNDFDYSFNGSAAVRVQYNRKCDDSKLDYKDHLLDKRRSQINAREANKAFRKLADTQIKFQDALDGLKAAAKPINKKLRKPVKLPNQKAASKMTVELLCSDLQIGKIMPGYDSSIARKRIQEYARAALFKIHQHAKSGYKIERIILAFLGDIIESSEKHSNSQRATDCSTPDQLKKAAEWLYIDLIYPLSQLGIPLDVKCVTGNHDWNDHGLNMYNPGQEHYSWPLYNFLKFVATREGLKNVSFDIPLGCFTSDVVYGHRIVWEHGVGVSASAASMDRRREERAKQLKDFVTFYRMGDKHHISRFNEDRLVVNGAFFGGDSEGREYSSISGYDSNAAQIMLCYVPRKKNDPRLPLYDSFVIQLSHIR